MRDYYGYRRRQRELVRRRTIAAILAGALGVVGFTLASRGNKDDEESSKIQDKGIGIIDELPNEDYHGFHDDTAIIYQTQSPAETPTPVPTVVPTIEPTPVVTPKPIVGGDSVIATTDVNMRLSDTADSFRLGSLQNGTVVDRLYTDGKWDVIRYGDTIAYVHSDYTREYEMDYNYEYYDIESYYDIVRTTDQLYFRVGPSTSEKDLLLLQNDEELVVIGKATIRSNPSDVWYLVKARGKIGFVSAKYTRSLRDEILRIDPTLNNIVVKKIARVTKQAPLYNENRDVIDYIDKFQLAHIIEQYDNYSLVNIDGIIGIMSNDDLSIIKGALLVCDLSTQRVFYYYNNEIAFGALCTTGKDSSPTEIGYFTPYGKADSHDFGHDNLKSQYLWMPFNGGQGLHDAPWQKSRFGDPSYRKHNGSAGCIRLPDEAAQFIYENVSMKTPILVKK